MQTPDLLSYSRYVYTVLQISRPASSQLTAIVLVSWRVLYFEEWLAQFGFEPKLNLMPGVGSCILDTYKDMEQDQ